jgi:hypothetical protein
VLPPVTVFKKYEEQSAVPNRVGKALANTELETHIQMGGKQGNSYLSQP